MSSLRPQSNDARTTAAMLTILAAIAATTGCGGPTPSVAHAADPQPLASHPNDDFNPSIVQILANKDHFNGKDIQISGFLVVEFEGTAIYLSKDDANYGITANGFWVTFDKDKLSGRDVKDFDQKYVLIEGKFNKDRRGHHSAWNGSIEDVHRVLVLEPHSHQRHN